MKITHNKVGQNLNTSDAKSTEKSGGVKKNSNAANSPAAPATSAPENSGATKVELSSRAQDIKHIKELAKNSSPDVDMDKVEKFKKLIADGKYKVDSKAVADRMVDEHLLAGGKTSNE